MDDPLSADLPEFPDHSMDGGQGGHGMDDPHGALEHHAHHDDAHLGATYTISPFAGGHLIRKDGLTVADISPFAGGQIMHTYGLGSSMHDQHLGVSEGHGAVYGASDHGGVYEAQHTPFTCAVVSQEMILHDFGINDVCEASLMGEAIQHGWLDANGTPMDAVGNLLELHGVHCHQGSGVGAMLNELAAGHKVIAAVDADTLWHDSPMASLFKDLTQGDTPNHALVIQGVKSDGHGGWSVVVNDPGDPHGAGKEYPMDQFVAAWKDSHCSYTATDGAPPHLGGHSEFGLGFDSDHGNYPGLLDWVQHHQKETALMGLAASAAFSARTTPDFSKPKVATEKTKNSGPLASEGRPPHTPLPMSDKARNDFLRSI